MVFALNFDLTFSIIQILKLKRNEKANQTFLAGRQEIKPKQKNDHQSQTK
jgi:hypothetical protein